MIFFGIKFMNLEKRNFDYLDAEKKIIKVDFAARKIKNHENCEKKEIQVSYKYGYNNTLTWRPSSMAVSSNKIYTAAWKGDIDSYDINNKSNEFVSFGPDSGTIFFSNQGKYCAEKFNENLKINLRRLDNLEIIFSWEAPSDYVINMVVFSPDDKYLAISNYGTGQQKMISNWIEILDLDNQRTIYQKHEARKVIDEMLFVPDQAKFISLSNVNKTISEINLASKEIDKIICFNDKIWSMALSPDNKILLTGLTDGSIEVQKWPSMKIIKKIPAQADTAGKIIYAPDGRFFASWSLNDETTLWDAHDFQKIKTWNGKTNFIFHQKEILLSDSTGNIEVWGMD